MICTGHERREVIMGVPPARPRGSVLVALVHAANPCAHSVFVDMAIPAAGILGQDARIDYVKIRSTGASLAYARYAPLNPFDTRKAAYLPACRLHIIHNALIDAGRDHGHRFAIACAAPDMHALGAFVDCGGQLRNRFHASIPAVKIATPETVSDIAAFRHSAQSSISHAPCKGRPHSAQFERRVQLLRKERGIT